jgi:Tol biopolymer transport system component
MRIYVIDPDGTNGTRLTTALEMSRPTWSPDGRQIAFLYDYTGDIGIVDADGRNFRQVPLRVMNPVGNLAWSPAGDLIAFNTWCGDDESGQPACPVLSMVRLEDENVVPFGPTGVYGRYPAWVRAP